MWIMPVGDMFRSVSVVTHYILLNHNNQHNSCLVPIHNADHTEQDALLSQLISTHIR